MSPTDLERMLDAVAAKAKGLRDVGVRAVEVGEIRIELADLEPAPAPVVTTKPDDAEPRDPLDDPDTFGGHLPQRRGHDHATAEDDDGRPDR